MKNNFAHYAKILSLSMVGVQLVDQRQFKFIFLGVLGLIFSFAVHILPANSQLIPDLKQTSTTTEQLVEQGKTFYQGGQFTQAVQSFQQAAEVYESQKDILNQALVLNYLSLTEQKLGLWEQANKAITTSLNLLTNSQLNTKESKRIFALVHNTKGSLQLAVGQAEAAVKSWQTAANIYQQIGETTGYIGSLINQATALQSLGRYRLSKNIFQQIKRSLESQTDSLVKVAGWRSLGNALRVSGDLKESMAALEKSLLVAENQVNPQEESATLLSLGNTYLAAANKNMSTDTTDEDSSLSWFCKGRVITDKSKIDYNKAADVYQKSFIKSPANLIKLQAQLNRLKVLLYLQQQPTIQELNFIKSTLANLAPSQAAVYARVNFAQSLVCLNQGIKAGEKAINNFDESVQLLNKAIQQAQELKDVRAESYALGNLGQIYEATTQKSVAQKYTESALNLAQLLNAADIAYQWQWQLGRIFASEGKSPEAIAAYSEAVNSLKSLRTDLVALNPDIQFDFRDQVEPVYRQLVALLLKSQQPSSENLKQARSVIETLQLAELDNFFRDACINAQPMQIDAVVDKANPATAVIYPIILADRLEVIVKLPQVENLRHYRIEQPQKNVESILEQLGQKIATVYDYQDHKKLGQEVYNWLIKPAEKELAQYKIKTLVFVLDGALRNIPMAALFDGEKYLVEKYSVALSPGLQLIEPKPQPQKFQGLTAGLTKQVENFSALNYVDTELKKIQAMIPAKQLLNETFTNTTIKNQVSSVSFPVVHLATHGKFSSQQEETFILTWNGRINANELREVLQAREDARGELSSQSSPIELLVLSACETATGDKRAALGLAGIAVRSGARSTLASLWKVNDESTSILMSEFYRQLTNTPNISKAEALSLAQKYVFQKYKDHPFFWAPYVLVGNWL